MKNSLRTILLLLLILFALQTCTVFADDSCGSGCTWSFDASTGTLTISGDGQMADYGNGTQPWYGTKDSITTVKVDGVTNICNYAFYNFTSLGSVTIGPSVTAIGERAFSKCSGLSFVTFEESSSLETIGGVAFNECTALQKIDLPGSLRTIEGSAFLNCSSLRSVTISDGTENIGDGAFNGCRSLTSVSIPASVTSIGVNPFLDCSALGSITVAEGNPAYKSVDGVLFSVDGDALKDLISFPMGKGSSYSIPAGVKAIGVSAFSGCSGLTSLTIPAGVTKILDYTFADCSGLTSLTFLPVDPPEVFSRAFFGFSTDCKFFVRTGSYLEKRDWQQAVDNFINRAKIISTITADPGITFSSEPAKRTYYGVDYYEAGSTITLNVPAGYAAEAYWNRNHITPVGGVYSFTMPAEDVVTLSASYDIITYTIAYELNEGALPQGVSNPKSYTVESDTIILNDPVQEGHLFGGWYKTADFTGSPVTEIPHGSTGNMTLYARWLQPVTLTAESRTVTYDTSEHVVTGFSASVPGLTFPGVHAEGRGTDAGSYPVAFTGVTPGKTEDSTGKYVVTETVEGTLTVEKAENTAIIEAEDYLTRGGHTLELADYVRHAAGDVSFTLKEANGCTLSGTVLTSGDLTGDCIVEVNIAGDKNHKPASGEITVKVIDKETVPLTVTQQGTTYGTPLPDPVWQIPPETLSAKGTNSGAAQPEIISEQVSYSGRLHDGSAYGPAAEKPTQAGEYVVEVIVETRSVIYFGYSNPFAIERKAVTVLADNKNKQQGEADPQLTASVGELLNGDSVSYELSREAGEEPGDYVIHAVGETLQGNYKVTYRSGTFTIIRKEDPGPDPDPDPDPVDPPSPVFFRLAELPRTGFSSQRPSPLTARPFSVDYRPTGLTLQIPKLDVIAPIVTVPYEDGQYPVEWLGKEAGLLEGSAEPGKGPAVLTGHNHLNTTEAGPFALLQQLDQGDLIFILDGEGELTPFTVCANEKIPAAGSAALKETMMKHPNSLTLLTCEDETPEGTYQNRRIITAVGSW